MHRTVSQGLQLAGPMEGAAKAAASWTSKDVLTSSDQFVPTLSLVSYSCMFNHSFSMYLSSFAQLSLLLHSPPQWI